MANKIHPTAIVDAGCELGDHVEIGPFCRVENNVRIGDGCVLQSNVFIDSYTTLGVENFVGHGTVIGTPPQDLKWTPAKLSYVEIGDRNLFREYVTINRATGEGAVTRVGSDCMLMANCHLAHNCQIADRVIMANLATLAGHCQVGEFCQLGGMAAVQQFCRIGKGAFIGGQSALRKDFPPYFRGAGWPTKPSGVNSVGMSRRGVPAESIKAVQRAYRILYHRSLTILDAVAEIEKNWPDVVEIQELVAFIRSSEVGICRPRME